jgi:hypothetical protein
VPVTGSHEQKGVPDLPGNFERCQCLGVGLPGDGEDGADVGDPDLVGLDREQLRVATEVAARDLTNAHHAFDGVEQVALARLVRSDDRGDLRVGVEAHMGIPAFRQDLPRLAPSGLFRPALVVEVERLEESDVHPREAHRPLLDKPIRLAPMPGAHTESSQRVRQKRLRSEANRPRPPVRCARAKPSDPSGARDDGPRRRPRWATGDPTRAA